MRPCLFLDRDVIIAARPGAEPAARWQDCEIRPAAVDWVRLCNALDILVIVLTNQPAVARGTVTHHEIDRLHGQMRAELAARGASIDDLFLCPHEGGTCNCAKPRPGMALAAAVKWKIDLHRSLIIGDPAIDRQLALRCGMRFLAAEGGRLEALREALAA